MFAVEYKLNNSYTTPMSPELTWFVISYSYDEAALSESQDGSCAFPENIFLFCLHQLADQWNQRYMIGL